MSRAHVSLSAAGRTVTAPHHTLLTEAEEREQLKIESMRQRREQRRQRFLQAHTRMYGVRRRRPRPPAGADDAVARAAPSTPP